MATTSWDTVPPRAIHARRSGAILVLTTAMLLVLMGFIAFAIDLGHLCVVRAQAQNAADAAALAATMELITPDRLRGLHEGVFEEARLEASQYARQNPVGGLQPTLAVGDTVIGRLDNPRDLSEALSFNDPSRFNSVQVQVQRTDAQNGPVEMFFAKVWGIDHADVLAQATATFDDGIRGFRATEKTGNADLIPFALNVNDWNNLIDGGGDDNWSYQGDDQGEVAGAVAPGGDGIREMLLFPERSNSGGIVPGNFGTVAIGDGNLSTTDLSRQILQGISQADMAYHGGELSLDPLTGRLLLGGDTGIDAQLEPELRSIVGQPRTIFLYETVIGSGSTAVYNIVGFAGVRLLEVQLTGSNKHVTVQPTFVIDDSALSGGNTSYFVTRPLTLSR